MALINSIIGFIIVILLLRLLIRQVEINFNQIYSLIYRITDPILKPAKTIFRDDIKAVLLSVAALVIIRGLFDTGGIGGSFLNLLNLLFQFYMAVWFITILAGDIGQTQAISMMQRAFLPLSKLASKLGIPRKSFSVFSFITIFIIYVLLSVMVYAVISFGSSFPVINIAAVALLLIIGLFTGFFTLVIIVGALLSWVSPDPYNPVVQAIYGISEPLLMPFRKIIPNLGGIDISPIIAILCFQFIGGQLASLLKQALF